MDRGASEKSGTPQVGTARRLDITPEELFKLYQATGLEVEIPNWPKAHFTMSYLEVHPHAKAFWESLARKLNER